jgi:hypothetical protein
MGQKQRMRSALGCLLPPGADIGLGHAQGKA